MDKKYREKYRRLGLKIAYFRKLNGYTQETFAEKIGMSAVFLSQVEAPGMDAAISLDTLFTIADALGVPAYKFLDFDDD